MALRRYFFPAMVSVLLGSCVKDTIVLPPEEEGTAPALVMAFNATANNKPLVTKTGWYSNQRKDSFSVSILNYYISNIKLTRSDGFVYAEPESYHLIKHQANQTAFTISGLPEGTYTKVEFIIGVDSARNVSGSQTGSLDPVNEMFWEWNTGYKFFVMEGAYTSTSITEKSDYSIHIGGFTGKYSCLQKASFALSAPIIAKKNGQSKLYYNTVVDEIFKSPNAIGFDDYYAAVGLPMFQAISQNYSDMFVVEKTEN